MYQLSNGSGLPTTPVWFLQTLTKVLAAVLKFSSDQTQKVLEREEQRQSAVSDIW